MPNTDIASRFDALPSLPDDDAVLDVLFDGWEGDGRRGRNLLLGRLRAYRAARPRDAVRPVADVIYRTLICFGEAVSDMSFVHLAVECRDVLVYEPRAGAR